MLHYFANVHFKAGLAFFQFICEISHEVMKNLLKLTLTCNSVIIYFSLESDMKSAFIPLIWYLYFNF